MKATFFVIALILGLTACNDDSVESTAVEATADGAAPAKPLPEAAHTVKPQGPVEISYRIVGTPIVGQPVAIDLQVQSVLGPQAVTLSYRINDATAMQLPDAQPARVSIAARTDDTPSLQQVRVIPLREGRLYLNVSADVETESGTLSTVIAIPIEVGGASPRLPQDNGVVTTDDNGEQVRVLQGEQ